MATIHPFPTKRQPAVPSLQFFLDQIRRRLVRQHVPVFGAVPFDSRQPRRDFVPLVDVTINHKPEAVGVALNAVIGPIDDPDGYSDALRDLLATGKHRCGGGAAPIFDLTLHNPGDAA